MSLRIPAGRLTALVGLSGSGKSTLVALMQRLYDPCEGAILLAGRDLRDLDASWFRRRVGFVSQDPRLFGMTVAENIGYGWPGATQASRKRGERGAGSLRGRAGGPPDVGTPALCKACRQRLGVPAN